MSSLTAFEGTVPAHYDQFLGPALFEPYALDLVERIQNKPMNNILEIACGTGRLTRHLISVLPKYARLTATDLNSDMIEMAKRTVKDDRISWQVVDAQNLLFADNSFDMIICQFGVMFFPDKITAFKEAYKVLKPEGVFIFNTWDELKYNLATVLVKNALDSVLKEKAPDFLTKGPFSLYNKDDIKNMMQESGFHNISIDTVKKQSVFNEPDDIIHGFLDGTPLSIMTSAFNSDIRMQIEKEIRSEIRKAYSNSNVYPMQALVCSAVK